LPSGKAAVGPSSAARRNCSSPREARSAAKTRAARATAAVVAGNGHAYHLREIIEEPDMAALAELDAAPDTIEAELSYLAKPEKLVTYVAKPGDVDQREGGANITHRVSLHNGRPLADRFEFEREGFRFVPHRSQVGDFTNDAEIRRVYYKECEDLIKQISGARRVVVFDHTLRTASGTQRETQKIRDIVSRVHNDYTEWSGPQRVRDVMEDEAETLLEGRFAIIQVWRPINHPVESHPLAICDAQTMKPETLVINERRYPDRVGQTYAITYDPDQRWYWFPRMRPDEALVFKVYESLRDGRARWTAHSAFKDPTAPPHARPRESIEIRTLAFF
jgi:hypothetical protein